MKTAVHISLVLALFLSSSALAAAKQPKKPKAADNKTAEVQTPAQTAEPNAPIASAEIKSADVGKVVVTVNGTKITEGQVDEVLAPRMQQMASRVPENMQPQYRQQIRKQIINNLIIEELLAEKEKENKIDVNQAELDAMINKLAANQNLTLDEFKSLLKAYGTTFAEYQQNVQKKLMFDKLMNAQFAEKLPAPTDEQLKAYYNENIQQFQKPEAIHAEHILCAPAKDANDPNKALEQAKAKAEDILKKIKAGGSFEELAKQYSDCPSSKQGGDLGVQVKGSLVPDFEKAAYALKPGEISDVVQTQFGYHIIKLVAHFEPNTVKFEEAKDDIKQSINGKEKEKIVMDYIQKIQSAATVKYADEADKIETEISGTKQAPPSRKIETAAPETNAPASKETK